MVRGESAKLGGGFMTTAVGVSAQQAAFRRFYVGMAGLCLLIAFGGFVPTYWAKLADGTFSGAPILHIHGGFFFLWTLFFFVQTTLVASGRVLRHRDWGLAGISLATAMVFTVVLAAINSMHVADAQGLGDAARRFSIVSLSAAVLFAGLFGSAIALVRKIEWHRRLMLLAMIPLMQAAMARVFMVLLAPPGAVGPPPVAMALPPGLLVDLLIVAGAVYDWRTRGRVHPAYLIGGSIILAVQVLTIPLAGTDAWMSIAAAVQSLTG